MPYLKRGPQAHLNIIVQSNHNGVDNTKLYDEVRKVPSTSLTIFFLLAPIVNEFQRVSDRYDSTATRNVRYHIRGTYG
jgi:hypothetical protein